MPNQSFEAGGAELRTATVQDAAELLRLKQQLDSESAFMLLEPDERNSSPAELARALADLAATGNSVVIVAEADGDLVGYVELTGGEFRRNRTTAYLVIGVVAKAAGRGVGAGLLRAARSWAAANGVHRIELTVMADNHRARALYERAGFTIEGHRRECLRVDGRFVDELHMAVLLP